MVPDHTQDTVDNSNLPTINAINKTSDEPEDQTTLQLTDDTLPLYYNKLKDY
jgi:hypothetical protein